MKKILITGLNSYIGTSFKNWVSNDPCNYSVDKISMRDSEWIDHSFSKYDVIFHTAAIVHTKEKNPSVYYEVNRDLTINLARKAKRAGVKQFIFLSTMGVYGTETGVITEDSMPAPKTEYAKSKLDAEKGLQKLASRTFKVVIIRPPLVYGEGCPGNYKKLETLALKCPVFPDVINRRSMIYIDNLSEFVKNIVDLDLGGLFFPQNKDYISTTELIKNINYFHNNKTRVSKYLNWVVSIGMKWSETLRKVFGSFIYDKSMPGGPESYLQGKKPNYETVSFKESIKCSKGKEKA
ncbi:NAD-dependent epimerase/dehydratase family protein [Halobacillus mangrovi]|uniref:NAD-dependent epimerase n=1 Tax=Halobacillus mangrovi TaxID=402384 RepID=A0A1W5ZSJ5_9BACI|nr:NAD-dependent epimerase/dehydratase family protein [Halobacillus mangrovi]ARI76253.1 NAD-dependent epimerase [Halobacillus mangrovi]